MQVYKLTEKWRVINKQTSSLTGKILRDFFVFIETNLWRITKHFDVKLGSFLRVCAQCSLCTLIYDMNIYLPRSTMEIDCHPSFDKTVKGYSEIDELIKTRVKWITTGLLYANKGYSEINEPIETRENG